MMKRACVVLALSITAMDQAIKALIRMLPVGGVFCEIPHIVSIARYMNTGAAFSLFAGQTALVTVVSALLLALIPLVFLRFMRVSRAGKLAFAALIGGGLGNLIDRLAWGSVTDYIRLLFIDFPVFNFADIAITVSVGIILLQILTDRLEERG